MPELPGDGGGQGQMENIIFNQSLYMRRIADVDVPANYLTTKKDGVRGKPVHLDRRQFLRSIAKLPVCFALGPTASYLLANNVHEEIGTNLIRRKGLCVGIPLPIQMVIDDVGWWCGPSGVERQEPYRAGISRYHEPADYETIVHLARALGIRPQAAMVLCEWDTANILRKLPTSTWMGKNWDNSTLIKRIGPQLEEAAEILRNNSQHIEITVHGIGHEYWTSGKLTRAE